MEVRTGSLFFPALRGSGPRVATQAVIFPREVTRAIAGLSGYSAGFSGDDHHLGELDIRLDTTANANVVEVTATFGLRDWSGNWDDDYTGTVLFSVLADLVSATEPPPRTDLLITGFEITQATQHFRDTAFLDPQNSGPDNSIRLVARKDTAIRMYVDYDRDAGLPAIPAITDLSGELQVRTSIGSTQFTLGPIATITPREDAQIDRTQADHTLNFRIPEAWCQGELQLTGRVFDAASPAEKSLAYSKSIRFDDRSSLRVYGVGVHYTGQGLDLAAPSQADVQSTMVFVEKVYPTGEVLLTGYTTIDFSDDMKADIADGCGDGFSSLLDRLRDLRGSSSDIYYAVLPSGGIDSGNVGGCGGGGVGAGFVGSGRTAAHEIGHAFGRDHAPCDSESRCDDPADQDSNFPDYDSFPSDSIGEIGFDPATNTTFDPAMRFDFMGYSSGKWVSPYTYTGLMGEFPSSSGLGSGSAMAMLRGASSGSPFRVQDDEWNRAETETLFLGFTVERDGTVRRRPSFHFAAVRSAPKGRRTRFLVELRDAEGRVLSCQPLHEDCKHCRGECWPKRLRDAVPFPDGAKKLAVVRDDEVLYEEDIPDPPDVQVTCEWNDKEQQFELTWSAKASGPKRRGRQRQDQEPDQDDLWFLVQWLDWDGTWRGVAPRTRKQAISIAPALVGYRSSVEVRVLASAGIATGVGRCTLEGPSTAPPTDVVLTEDPTNTEIGRPAGLVRVSAIDSTGRTVLDAEIRWYDESGAEIGFGRTLDVQALGEGQHVVRAVVPDLGGGVGESVVAVDVGPDGTLSRCEVVPRGLRPNRDMHTHEGPDAVPPHPRPTTKPGAGKKPGPTRSRGTRGGGADGG